MKQYLFSFLHLLGASRFAAWRNRRRVTILCYHGVTERKTRNPNDPTGLHIRRERFSRQLDYLKRNYNVVPLSKYISCRREGQSLPPYSVVLTFDDGYRNFFTVAAAELTRRQLPATVFLITDRMNSDSNGDGVWTEADDERCLSWEEARSLRTQYGIEFGSHTCSHPKLTNINTEESQKEMTDSFKAVRAQLKSDGISLAYPYGDYSSSVAAAAEAVGYQSAVTTDEGPNEPDANLFTLRRTLIGDDDDDAAFAARVSGLIAWLRVGKASYPETN
jgi:peptidoglycan/xylan/chitin deacetylase (PgdA/CDA1 family)